MTKKSNENTNYNTVALYKICYNVLESGTMSVSKLFDIIGTILPAQKLVKFGFDNYDYL